MLYTTDCIDVVEYNIKGIPIYYQVYSSTLCIHIYIFVNILINCYIFVINYNFHSQDITNKNKDGIKGYIL